MLPPKREGRRFAPQRRRRHQSQRPRSGASDVPVLLSRLGVIFLVVIGVIDFRKFGIDNIVISRLGC